MRAALSATASLLFALIGCGGRGGAAAPGLAVSIQPRVEPPEQTVCAFEGNFSGTLRFGDTDERVEARTADARLFASRLEVHASGGGWHLTGHSNLRTDHVLRLQQATWLGEGVAADSGQHVAVRGGEVGRVFVRPHPSALEHVQLREPVGRWLGCEAVGIAWALHDPALGALELPLAFETGDVELPFSLSAARNEEPFAEVRRHPYEEAVSSPGVFARFLERNEEWTRVAVARFGADAEEGGAILVGWVEASRLGHYHLVHGLHTLGTDFDVDHEECTASAALTLFIEGPGGRVEAGRIDAETRFVVDGRDGSFAAVRPLGNALRLTRDRRFYVPSGTLECTTIAGTHVRHLHRVQVHATGLECGSECECSVRLATPHQEDGRCQARLWCGDELVFGDWSMGQFDCHVRDGHVSGADTEASDGSMGTNPRFSIDGDTITASDEAVGRLGAFTLEGRVLR